MAEEENEIVEKNTKEEIEIDFNKIASFFKNNQRILIYLILILLLIGGAYSRTRNVSNLEGKYLVSPDDPYVFLRYSTYVAENGKLPANDTLRYYPDGFDATRENAFMAYLAGYSFKFASAVNPEVSMFDIAAYLPPLLFVIALISFFFLLKEIFNDELTALVSTGILAFSPAILLRTVSGFLEKEPIFLPLFFISMYFFVKAYNLFSEKSLTKKDKRKIYLFASLCGIFTGLAAFASGLFFFIVIYISVFLIVEVLLQKMNKNKLIIYILWFIFTLVVTSLTTTKYGGFFRFYKPIQFQLPIIALIFGFVSVGFDSIKWLRLIKEKLSFIPKGLLYSFITFFIILLGGLIVLGPSGFVAKLGFLWEKVMIPFGTTKMAASVSENQPPVFLGRGSSWWNIFGVVFLMFFLGAIALFHKEFKRFRYGKYLVSVFPLFSLALVFENFSHELKHRWITILFSQQWFFMLLFGLTFIIFLFLEHKSHEHIEKINSINLLVIVWYLVSIVAANGAVRLFFIMATPAAMLAGYFIKWCKEQIPKFSNKEILQYVPHLLIAAFVIFSFVNVSSAVAHMKPGLGIWYESMNWIKEDTPEDAIFTHWWDYGYLIQTMANRKTVGDPGNFYKERNYDVGGHVFNAFNNSEILWFTDKYNLTDKDVYLLIPSEDILKFVQIAKLGSLSEGTSGREVYFTLFGVTDPKKDIIPNNLKEYSEYPMLILYEPLTGQPQILEDFRIGNYVYSGNKTFILRYLQPASQNKTGPLLVQIFDATTQKTKIFPVKCICEIKRDCYDLNETGVPTCALRIQGGILNIPHKSKDILFTQLYLLDKEIPGFEKVYDNGLPLDLRTAMGSGPLIRIYKYNFTALRENEGW